MENTNTEGKKTLTLADVNARLTETDKLIKNHSLYSIGVGLIPMPIVDFVALNALQLNLIRKLSDLYDVPFLKDKGKKLIGTMLGSGVPVVLSSTIASLLKFVPIVGYTTASLSTSIIGGASTYALGKVFVQHFESGGTFLDFDPMAVKEYFAKEFKEGQSLLKELSGSAAR
ncbi:YcjF family protein [Candidatus Magnetomonas plexicatena]|uniref:YcjF family protein n=1 Tax=Candidatus Magnetomonas plexicatena TaxID=2552947 RepID=UPI001C779BCA|nr:DUF697 domain-containing protein [Nitrospirales bacterium LBB_01]